MNGVGVVTCVYNAQRRELFLQYPTENLQCVHLTLVMSGHGYLNVVFVPKVVVVVHFTSDKGVSLCFNGFIEQKIAGAAAKGYSTDWAVDWAVVHETFRV